jgi:signal transduction histidine kinase
MPTMTAVDRGSALTSTAALGLHERRQLERDLHDGAQQRLVSLALTLRQAREQLETEPGEAARLLDRSRDELAQALRELRDLARGIHPAVLADRGLVAAVEALAGRAPLPVEVVSALPDRRLPDQVALSAYFVVSEALTNVAKHAAATAASVALSERDGELAIEIVDDGAGGADLARGTGLRGLAERVAAIGGRLEIESGPGRGTLVRARLPHAENAARGVDTASVSRL